MAQEKARFVYSFAGLAGLAGLAALAGCTQAPKPAAPEARRLPPHAGPPPAQFCQVAPFTVADGGSAGVAMTVSNEGGFCAATLTTSAGKPFDAPLVTTMPQNGTPAVWRYDGKTSVEYVPNAGFTGSDSFVTKLKIAGKPGYTTLTISITVQAAGQAAAQATAGAAAAK